MSVATPLAATRSTTDRETWNSGASIACWSMPRATRKASRPPASRSMRKPRSAARRGDHLIHHPVEHLVQVERRAEGLGDAVERGETVGLGRRSCHGPSGSHARPPEGAGGLPHHQLLVDKLQVRPAGLDPCRQPVEDLLRMRPVVAHHGAGDDRRRVAVLPVDFGRRTLNSRCSPASRGLSRPRFSFKGSTPGQSELDRQHGDVHPNSLAAEDAVGKVGCRPGCFALCSLPRTTARGVEHAARGRPGTSEGHRAASTRRRRNALLQGPRPGALVDRRLGERQTDPKRLTKSFGQRLGSQLQAIGLPTSCSRVIGTSSDAFGRSEAVGRASDTLVLRRCDRGRPAAAASHAEARPPRGAPVRCRSACGRRT